MSEVFTIERKDWEKKVLRIEKKFSQDAVEDIKFLLVSTAQEIRNEMIMSMRGTPKTGRKYKRRTVTHTASAPGNPPAIDTGNLIQSLFVDDRDVEIEVGSITSVRGKSLKYPPFLEFGAATATKKGGFKQEGVSLRGILFPRPFMEPALKKKTVNLENDILQVIIQSAGEL